MNYNEFGLFIISYEDIIIWRPDDMLSENISHQYALKYAYLAYFPLISFSKMTFSSLSVLRNLRPLLNTNIPLISGKYGLRN